jgi:hypothetical protein
MDKWDEGESFDTGTQITRPVDPYPYGDRTIGTDSGCSCVRIALFTTNSTWTSLGLNSGLRGEKLASNGVKHDMSYRLLRLVG